MAEHCLIIGAGQAGLMVAQSLREHGFAGAITLAGDERHAPYQRPPLSKKVLSGEMASERLALKPPAFFTAQAINWRGDLAIREVDTITRRAYHDGGTIAYDRLVLATGTSARGLAMRDLPEAGVFALRGIDDVLRLRAHIAAGRRLVIIGAGYIGLEVAAIASALGADVTVIEAASRVLARSVGVEMSRYFESVHRQRGVKIELAMTLEGIEATSGGLVAIAGGGRRFAADAVLIAIGSIPRTDMAAAAGLAVDDGIIVDGACRTSHEHVIAAGDCTRFFSMRYQRHIRLESVQNAIDQAKAAAATLAGGTPHYDPLPWFWSDQFDLKLQIAGLSQGHDRVILRGDRGCHMFSAFYFAGLTLLAVDTVNRPRDHMLARRMIGRVIRGDPAEIAREGDAGWETLFEG